jgi:predicted acylesterase/phospholipase RssA
MICWLDGRTDECFTALLRRSSGQQAEEKQGWHSGEALEAMIDALLKKKTGLDKTTFAQLREYQRRARLTERKLVVTATCLATQELVWFSSEATPNVSVAKAVRASSALPLFYQPVILPLNMTRTGLGALKFSGERMAHFAFMHANFLCTKVGSCAGLPENHSGNHDLVDGGIMANLPWDAFDDHKVTLHRLRIPSPTPL